MCYGPEFVAHAVREWLGRVGVTNLYIEPGSPWCCRSSPASGFDAASGKIRLTGLRDQSGTGSTVKAGRRPPMANGSSILARASTQPAAANSTVHD
ncbi:hypothetical protein BSL82_07680 [Tardibacter chloracetimidivorans]|uniref:Uncharacterized protein n=1 Tax=Tardibacter chloracetimidivorans TaxID=1921510 RepID=A0A1L3ZU84_9SPHN|nr:hypothetical protein BSL82_07680 [Tardibacter chloracetimidivorans]